MTKIANENGAVMEEKEPVCEPVRESQPDSAPEPRPSAELPDIEPELFERAKEAVTAIRGRGRRADGQATAGNTLALKHGLRSTRLLVAPDVAQWHQEQMQAITVDLGGDGELTALKRASVREVARLQVVAAALGDELLQHGVLTGKGKMRAATATYLQVLDRFVRLSATLGLERQAKRVPTIGEYLASRPQDAPRAPQSDEETVAETSAASPDDRGADATPAADTGDR